MKFSLDQQIEEINRELDYRSSVYPRLVSSGKLRGSIAEYQNARLIAARETLRWLQKNEDLVKHRLEN